MKTKKSIIDEDTPNTTLHLAEPEARGHLFVLVG